MSTINTDAKFHGTVGQTRTFNEKSAKGYTLARAFEVNSSAPQDFGSMLNTECCPPQQKLAGDFNGDGLVDNADLEVWTNSFGKSGEHLAADANGDGNVSGADYTVWADNFGKAAARRHGDFDDDGDVDNDDLKVFQKSFGAKGMHFAADANGDGKITGADYTVWADNFGNN